MCSTTPTDFSEICRNAFRSTLRADEPPHIFEMTELKWVRKGKVWSANVVKTPFVPSPANGIQSIALEELKSIITKYAPQYFEGTYCLGSGFALKPLDFIEGFVHESWKKWGRISINDEELQELTDSLYQVLIRKSFRYLLVAPVINLELPESNQRIDLDHQVFIGRLSDEEATDICNFSGFTPSGGQMAEYGIFQEREIPFSLGERTVCTEMGEIVKKFRAVELSLRLAKSGKIGIAGIYFLKRGVFNWGPRTACGFSEYHIPHDKFVLESEYIDKVKTNWVSLKNEVNPDLRSAIERLSLAEIRSELKDRLLDAAIGLEALLLHEGKDNPYRGELRFRFALHYGLLNGHSSDSRERFKKAQKIYDYRSQIAHGGSLSSEEQLQNAASDACAMLREVIYSFMVDNRVPENDFWMSKIFQTQS